MLGSLQAASLPGQLALCCLHPVTLCAACLHVKLYVCMSRCICSCDDSKSVGPSQPLCVQRCVSTMASGDLGNACMCDYDCEVQVLYKGLVPFAGYLSLFLLAGYQVLQAQQWQLQALRLVAAALQPDFAINP